MAKSNFPAGPDSFGKDPLGIALDAEMDASGARLSPVLRFLQEASKDPD